MNEKQLRAIYTMLRAFHPFNRWGLPPSEKVRFYLLVDEDLAQFSLDDDGKMYIAINPDKHLTLQQAIESVAHEMVHMRQEMLERLSDNPAKHHNADFRRMAKSVCRSLGFDIQRF